MVQVAKKHGLIAYREGNIVEIYSSSKSTTPITKINNGVNDLEDIVSSFYMNSVWFYGS